MKGYCSLIIKGDDLEFDVIEKSLGLKASKKYLKGIITSKVIGKNEYDLVRFDERINENQSPNNALELLLNKIIPSEDYIKFLKRQCDVILKSYIQSSNAQVRFDIKPDNIARINQLGIKLEISVLSWGGAEKE